MWHVKTLFVMLSKNIPWENRETSIVLSQPAPYSLLCSSYQSMIVSILRLEVLQTRWYCTPINKVICWQDSNEIVLWMSNVLKYGKTQRIYRRKYWHIELVRTNDKNLRTGEKILTIINENMSLNLRTGATNTWEVSWYLVVITI